MIDSRHLTPLKGMPFTPCLVQDPIEGKHLYSLCRLHNEVQQQVVWPRRR